MTLQDLGPTAAEVESLRTELDDLLRARQFAAQRERRLVEAVNAGRHAGHGQGQGHGYEQSRPEGDQELLRQLAQAQTLREGLGARCLQLSDRLLALEDRLQAERLSAGMSEPRTDRRSPTAPPGGSAPHPTASAGGTGTATLPGTEPGTGPTSGTVPPTRKRPTGARFGTTYESAAPEPSLPVVEARPLRGARFGGVQPAAPEPAPAVTAPRPTRTPAPAPAPAPDQRPTGTTQGAPYGASTAALRTPSELTALVQRITELHRRGSADESAAIVAQAAVMLAPTDVARLVDMLRTGGPAGAARYLARSVAYGAAEHAVGTLAELRRYALVDEAAELFHALWATPASALPALLAALEAAGQSADGQTLLWEWASAPPVELSDLAARLRDADRPRDVHDLLRQTAGRPVGEVAAVALALDQGLAAELVGAVVRVRSADDLATFAIAIRGEAERYGALLAAVVGLDENRARSALAALRTAGLPTEPAAHPRSQPRSRPRGRR